MVVLLCRRVFSLFKPGIILQKYSLKMNPSVQQVAIHFARNISSMEVTNNLTLLSKEKKEGTLVNLTVANKENKPLVIMLPWLLAKKKHVSKFARFYIQQGYDVLNVNVTPWQMLWPLKGTQVVAKDVVKFLDVNKIYSPLILHGFSVGGYMWSEVLVQLAAEQSRYQHILNRFVGQIWDSLADITEIPEGFPYAVFPKNKMLQSALRQYIVYHLKTFDKVATCHYIRGSQMFHTNIIKAPALFLVSKTDPIGTEKSNLRAKENWENMGIQVYWKCWDKSPHVGHFYYHPEEYLTEISSFLENIGMLSENLERQQLVKAKL